MTTRKRRQNFAATQTVNPEQVIIPPPANLGGQDLEKNTLLGPNLEVGTTGLAQFSGLIYQEPLVELRGKDAYKRYNEMRLNSPIIGALLLSIENPLRSTSWTFASETENDPRLDLLNAARENLEHSWNDHISEVLTMLAFGYSIFEVVYEMVGGQMLWKSFSPRGQDTVLRWLYEEVKNDQNDPSPKQRLKGFVQQAPPHYHLTPIPIERLLLYRLRVERDNPEGRSILRTAWVPYYFIKHLQQVEGIALERGGAGLPIITLPQGASTNGQDTDDAKAAKIVRNIRIDEQSGVVLPFGWAFDFAKVGTTMPDYDKVINRYEKRILTSALAQFLMLGQDGIGALALSKDQTDFFTMSVNAVGDIIADTFTQIAIPKLMELNGMSAEGLWLEHTPAQGGMGVTIIADFLQKVAPYITWTPEDEVWLRQIATLPDKTPEQLQQMMDDRNAAKDQAMADSMAKMRMGQVQNNPTAVTESPMKPGETGKPAPAQMNADFYGSAGMIDEKGRLKREKQWAGAMDKFFGEQKKRILKAAKDIQR